MDMRKLRLLAAELKAAYELQEAVMLRQSQIRAKVIDMLGPTDGGEFIDMLRYQAEPRQPQLEAIFADDDRLLIEGARVKFRVHHGKA